jgi:hypothetical protein
MAAPSQKKNIAKRLLIAAVIVFVIGAGIAVYLFTDSFEDTASVKADYTVSALPFMNEFKLNDTLNPAANKKYAEKIITVNGKVSAVENADSTTNLKIENVEGAYILFAFQRQDQSAVKQVKAGDSISIKGSCNGASFSEILGVPFITFKRCSLNK